MSISPQDVPKIQHIPQIGMSRYNNPMLPIIKIINKKGEKYEKIL